MLKKKKQNVILIIDKEKRVKIRKSKVISMSLVINCQNKYFFFVKRLLTEGEMHAMWMKYLFDLECFIYSNQVKKKLTITENTVKTTKN